MSSALINDMRQWILKHLWKADGGTYGSMLCRDCLAVQDHRDPLATVHREDCEAARLLGLAHEASSPPEWTFEPHGPGEVLYRGRSSERHGYNIMMVVDPAVQWERVKARILELLNRYGVDEV